MLTQKHLTNAPATRASILMKTGACVGGTIIGYISQWFGRRRTIIVAALMSAFLIPAWILPEGERSLSASGFFMQFFVQGAWGKFVTTLMSANANSLQVSFPSTSMSSRPPPSAPASLA